MRTHTSGSDRSDSQKKITLPQLNTASGQSNSTLGSGPKEAVDNPFFVPDDHEIFKMKQHEQEIRKQDRLQQMNLKVWEKGIKNQGAFTIGGLQQMCQIDQQQQDDITKVNIVDAAHSAIKNRVRSKEPMHQFIDQKRQMLLFQMLIDHKREQINFYQDQTRQHKRGLEKSEQMLEEDLEAFNRFLQENKNQSRAALKAAETETKLKQERILQIQNLNDVKTDLQTKNSQKLETLQNLYNYKSFLDTITPQDFLEEQRKKKEARKKMSDRSKTQEQREKQQKGFENYVNLTQEINQLLEDSDDQFEMYFQQPEDLEKIFEDLEEGNIFLITNTKEFQQGVEELQSQKDQREKQLNAKKQQLQLTKKQILKAIDNVQDQIKILKQIRGGDQVQDHLALYEKQIKDIYIRDYQETNQPDLIKKDGIQILKEIERELQKNLKDLSSKRVYKGLRELEKEVYNATKLKLKAQKEQELQQLEERTQLNFNEPQRQRRQGRPIMQKNLLEKEKQQEAVVKEMPEEERDNIKFFSDQNFI